MSEEPFGLIASVLSRFGLSYKKETAIHTIRLETDDLEKCKPKIVRKRKRLFIEKTLLVHYKDDDDYVILDLK